MASWMTRSKNPSESESGSFSARTCYMLHGMLVIMHIALIISYINRWEHHATLPFTSTNTDFWPVVLSASLQAFYTLYTAILVFLTQQLAMSSALVRRLKLTTIHDISSAWAGLGSALSSIWKQTSIPASLWATTTVATYLVCISVLHITSSTLLQFQTFNSSMPTNVSTTLGWVDVTNVINPVPITASLPAISQFPGLVSAGLSGNTVYDTLQTSSAVGHATVNATTITSSCGLIPNVTYSQNDTRVIVPLGNESVLRVSVSPPWTDQIQVLEVTPVDDVLGLQPSIILMVSTLLNIEPSVRKEVAVPMIWESYSTNYSIEVFLIQCLLSTNNTTVVIDMQTNTLQNPMPVLQPSTQWKETHQWINTYWSSYVGWILAKSGSNGYQFVDEYEHITEPSIVDNYIMSLVGLNLTAQYDQSLNSTAFPGPPVSNFTLSPDKLDATIAQIVAQLTWMAGRVGPNGGIQPGEGVVLAYEDVTALRLNIILLPLLFATSASVIMLGLALHTTRALHASCNNQALVSDIGALQLLWLGSYSESVREALQDVGHPTETNLRRAGMVDVCFATTSDEEELTMRTLIDGLSVQAVDHGDGMSRWV